MKNTKKIISLVLAICMLASLAISASAANTVDASGGTGTSSVTLSSTADGSIGGDPAATKMSVTVPTVLPIAVGTDGTLSVVKDMGLKEPYVGVIPLVSGEIAEDIASYYATSEQIPTVCSLGVLVNPDLTVKSAGGFLVQLLPFADEKVIDVIEKNISEIRPISAMLDEGKTPEEIANMLLKGLDPNVLDTAEPVYGCDCSRERTEKVLISLGEKELKEMADEGKDTTVCCHFCGKEYVFTPDELRSLIK